MLFFLLYEGPKLWGLESGNYCRSWTGGNAKVRVSHVFYVCVRMLLAIVPFPLVRAILSVLLCIAPVSVYNSDRSTSQQPNEQTSPTWRYNGVDYTCNDFQTVCATYFGPGNTGACYLLTYTYTHTPG